MESSQPVHSNIRYNRSGNFIGYVENEGSAERKDTTTDNEATNRPPTSPKKSRATPTGPNRSSLASNSSGDSPALVFPGTTSKVPSAASPVTGQSDLFDGTLTPLTPSNSDSREKSGSMGPPKTPANGGISIGPILSNIRLPGQSLSFPRSPTRSQRGRGGASPSSPNRRRRREDDNNGSPTRHNDNAESTPQVSSQSQSGEGSSQEQESSTSQPRFGVEGSQGQYNPKDDEFRWEGTQEQQERQEEEARQEPLRPTGPSLMGPPALPSASQNQSFATSSSSSQGQSQASFKTVASIKPGSVRTQITGSQVGNSSQETERRRRRQSDSSEDPSSQQAQALEVKQLFREKREEIAALDPTGVLKNMAKNMAKMAHKAQRKRSRTRSPELRPTGRDYDLIIHNSPRRHPSGSSSDFTSSQSLIQSQANSESQPQSQSNPHSGSRPGEYDPIAPDTPHAILPIQDNLSQPRVLVADSSRDASQMTTGGLVDVTRPGAEVEFVEETPMRPPPPRHTNQVSPTRISQRGKALPSQYTVSSIGDANGQEESPPHPSQHPLNPIGRTVTREGTGGSGTLFMSSYFSILVAPLFLPVYSNVLHFPVLIVERQLTTQSRVQYLPTEGAPSDHFRRKLTRKLQKRDATRY
jgi:hypothetical protein